jgi:hypothetical protein
MAWGIIAGAVAIAVPVVAGQASGAALGARPATRGQRGVAAGAPLETKVFKATGQLQTFEIPEGVTTLHVTAVGGHGGHGFDSVYNPGGSGGLGGKVSADIPVLSEDRLIVAVGGDGQNGSFAFSGDGGFNGGGNGGTQRTGGGGGGGESDIRDAPGAYAPLILAAGGGGGGSSTTFRGGRGASYRGNASGNGTNTAGREVRCYGLAGGDGSADAPGKGGKARLWTALSKGDCPHLGVDLLFGANGQYFASPPTGGRGGGTFSINGGGGGAGGGFFGGGGGGSGSNGGSGAGGGAGSSSVEPSATNPTFQTAAVGEAPSITISYQPPPAPARVDLTVSPVPGYTGEPINLNATVHGGPTPRPHVSFLFARCSTSGHCDPAHRLGDDEVDPNGTAHFQLPSLPIFDCYVFFAGYADAGDRTLDTIGCYQVLSHRETPTSNAPPTNVTTSPSPS